MISMVEIEDFFELVDRYAKAKSISVATVSTQLFNDGKRMKLLKGGGDVGVRKVSEAVRVLSSNWPKEMEWPQDIKRPSSRRR